MIFLVRHGQTEFNAEGRAQGALHSDLSDLGRRQADMVGRLLRDNVENPAAIPLISSPQGRALQTADRIRVQLGHPGPVVQDERLREVTLGSWDGLLYTEIAAGWPDAMGSGAGWFFESPDGDRYEAFRDRLAGWLVEAEGRQEALVAVTHGVASRVIRGVYLGLSKQACLALRIPQDAAFCLADGEVRELRC